MWAPRSTELHTAGRTGSLSGDFHFRMRDQMDRDPLAILEASVVEAKEIIRRSRALLEVSKTLIERASSTIPGLTETARQQRELAVRVRKATRLSPWPEGES